MLNIMQFIIYSEFAILVLAIAGVVVSLYSLLKGWVMSHLQIRVAIRMNTLIYADCLALRQSIYTKRISSKLHDVLMKPYRK